MRKRYIPSSIFSIHVIFQSESTKKNFSGFLIDNIGDEEEEEEESSSKKKSKSHQRTTSKSSNGSSTNTIRSGSPEDDDDEATEENNLDSKSKNSDDDTTVEMVKNYRTRSRTAADEKQKSHSSTFSAKKYSNGDIFDAENDHLPLEESVEDHPDDPWLDEMRKQFWFPFLDMLPDESEFDTSLSGKFFLLQSILEKCAEIGDKIILFSRSLYTLNYIERFLYYLQRLNEEEYQKKCQARRQLQQMLSSTETSPHMHDYIPSPTQWIRDEDYFRMDGSTDVTARKRYAQAFNNENNIRARLFLISTLAGGIGINLVGSNRVIVFDASWNPR